MPPVTTALIIANVVAYLLQSVAPGLELALALWPLDASRMSNGQVGFALWQLVTYGFLHGGFTHLFFNMFALYMFGSDIERLFGSRRYLFYYLTCVVGAAAMHLIVTSVGGGMGAPVVGASGGVFGLLLAYGMAFPKRTLMLIFPPIPMPAWLFVTLYGIFELVMGVTQTASGIAHFAHLGGMATGFVIIRYWRAQRRRRS